MNGSYSIVTSTTVLSLESKWPWNMELSHLLSLPVFVVLTFFGRAMYFVFFPGGMSSMNSFHSIDRFLDMISVILQFFVGNHEARSIFGAQYSWI